MRTIRHLAVASATVVVLLGAYFITPARAGEPVAEVSADVTCDEATGTYVLTVTVQNNTSVTGSATGEYLYSAGAGGGVGDLTFAPDPLPANGTSTATASIPGDATFVSAEIEVETDGGDVLEEFDQELAGDCVASATTSTTADTVTTTAPAVVAATQPRFTG